jgi:hypothetical protein
MNWIDASKELPDDEQVVLVHTPGASEPVWLGYVSWEYDIQEGVPWYLIDGSEPRYPVKHWMPLPEGPK